MNYLNSEVKNIESNIVEIVESSISNTLDISSTINTIETVEIVDPILHSYTNEKVVVSKKNYYCINCNRRGHTYKNCLDSVISNGIIGIYIENFDQEYIPILEDYIVKNLRIFNKYTSNSFKNKNTIWLENLYKLNENDMNPKIKFLMVQRKNSLGYLEFIRGRYNINEPNTITHLIHQMSPEELYDVRTKDFELLWNNLWDKNNIKNKNHHKEFLASKQKFNDLKNNYNQILMETKNIYSFNEWGFPKGRREPYESDLVCAVREFEEETCYKDNKYILLEQTKSIRENLIGTNGIGYAHNYFLSILLEKIETLETNNREIGNVKILNINECIELIRPYHKNKIKIVKYIYNVINDFFKEHSFLEN